MHWRAIVYRYQQACLDDLRRDDFEPHRQQFIREWGTDDLQVRDQQFRARVNRQREACSLPSPASYNVVEESSSRVVVDCDSCDLPMPFRSTRFVLIRFADGWQLDDVLWKCTCRDGACVICNGSGACRVCDRHGDSRSRPARWYHWLIGLATSTCGLCDGNAKCRMCAGTGQCDSCGSGPMPGWHRWGDPTEPGSAYGSSHSD